MNEAIPFERVDDIGVFRRVGNCTALQAAKLITAVILQAREQGISKLLLFLTNLKGYPPPTLSERHRTVRAWADAAQGRVRVAMVVSPDFIDPEKFGVVAAANFGLAANVFASEASAIAWLRDGTP